jgi:uncharacterized protein
VVSTVYLDSSALLKRYIVETGTSWVLGLFAPPNTSSVFVSHVTAVEITCALARRRRDGTIAPDIYTTAIAAFEYDMAYRFNVIDITPITIDTASRLAKRQPLRANDALQLATAWLANRELVRAKGPPLTFICADNRLITIAQAESLRTDNPLDHP